FSRRSGSQHHFIGRVLAQYAAEFIVGFRFDNIWFEAADETGAGINNRFEKVLLGADLANRRQVGADVPDKVAHSMTGVARSFLTIEHGLSSPDITFAKRGHQFGEVSALLGGVRLERG